jgi:hypothetical protein
MGWKVDQRWEVWIFKKTRKIFLWLENYTKSGAP